MRPPKYGKLYLWYVRGINTSYEKYKISCCLLPRQLSCSRRHNRRGITDVFKLTAIRLTKGFGTALYMRFKVVTLGGYIYRSDIIDRHIRSITSQALTIARPELSLLIPLMRCLRQFLDLRKLKFLLWEGGVDALSIVGANVVDLGEISLLYHRIPDESQQVGCVANSVLPLSIAHNAAPKLFRLVIVTLLTFMPVVALAGNDIVANEVWCLCNVWTKFVREAVWHVLLIAGMVGINAHLAIEVQG